MAEKKTNSWQEVHTVIVFFAMTALFALWNLFATVDRQQATCKMKNDSVAAASLNAEVDERALAVIQRKNFDRRCITFTGSS